MLRSILSPVLAVMFATPVVAHELWLEPLDYTIGAGATIEAAIYNGQDFGGTIDGEDRGASQLAYFPNRIAVSRTFFGDESTAVTGEIGQTPAIQVAPLSEGLHAVAYISTPATLNYEEWEKFQRFIDHKDLGDILPQHEARDLPLENFLEVYIRNSKTLVAVGDGAGEDRRTGMETEIVALANPYVDDLNDGLPVQLWYQGNVRANEQIELFEKGPDDAVIITLVRTNDEGIAILPVRPGYSYMADAVVLREPSPARAEQTGAVWETLWANLTFSVPAQ